MSDKCQHLSGTGHTRECLSIDVERSITAKDVVARLRQLFERRGAPDFIRSDNGPEFIAIAVKEWLKDTGVKTLYIEPGSPWENVYSETFNSRFEDELLNQEIFSNLVEAKVLVEEYRVKYPGLPIQGRQQPAAAQLPLLSDPD